MKGNTEYTLWLRKGQVTCRNFSMARKMFDRLSTAVAMVATNLENGQAMIYKTR